MPTADRQAAPSAPVRPGEAGAVGAVGAAGMAGAAGARGPRLSARHLGLTAAMAVVIAAALVIGVRLLPHGPAPGAGPGGTSTGAQTSRSASVADVYGVPVRSAGCPAAAIRGAVARCPASPECFNGMNVFSGSASAEPLPCDQPHVWETFAIAILPAEAQTFDQPVVKADATVRKVCAQAVMLASRQGPARRQPAQDWLVDVLTPSEAAFDSGSRVYRCIAHDLVHEPRTSQFRR